MEWPWIKAQREAHAATLEELRRTLEAVSLAPRPAPTTERLELELSGLDTRLGKITGRLDELAAELERVKVAVAHGIEHEDRRERRIEATVRRARKKLAELGVEDGALEAEFDGLPDRDGEGGGQRRLFAMPGDVGEGARMEASSIKGVSREILSRVRGL